MDVEPDPADVAGVRIRYRLWSPKYTIAVFALWCSILIKWQGPRRLTDTSAVNRSCYAGLGALRWEGSADEEIVLFSCALTHPAPKRPHPLPSKAPPPPRQGTHRT